MELERLAAKLLVCQLMRFTAQLYSDYRDVWDHPTVADTTLSFRWMYLTLMALT